MAHLIHRTGDRYRLWSTITDTYLCEPLSRAEMAARLASGVDLPFPARCFADRPLDPDVIEAQLVAADARGTSAPPPYARTVPGGWEPEADHGRWSRRQ